MDDFDEVPVMDECDSCGEIVNRDEHTDECPYCGYDDLPW